MIASSPPRGTTMVPVLTPVLVSSRKGIQGVVKISYDISSQTSLYICKFKLNYNASM
jgi:hypothetical protein